MDAIGDVNGRGEGEDDEVDAHDRIAIFSSSSSARLDHVRSFPLSFEGVIGTVEGIPWWFCHRSGGAILEGESPCNETEAEERSPFDLVRPVLSFALDGRGGTFTTSRGHVANTVHRSNSLSSFAR